MAVMKSPVPQNHLETQSLTMMPEQSMYSSSRSCDPPEDRHLSHCPIAHIFICSWVARSVICNAQYSLLRNREFSHLPFLSG